MIVDITIGIILIFSIIWGYRRGFFVTLIHLFGWIGSIVAAVFLLPPVKSYISSNTSVYDNLCSWFDKSFSGLIEMNNMQNINENKGDGLGFSGILGDFSDTISSAASKYLSDILFSLLCFILIILVIKVICLLIERIFCNGKKRGVTGMANGILGAATGLVKGLLISLLLVTLAIPVAGMISANAAEILSDWMNESLFMSNLFSFNFLVNLI